MANAEPLKKLEVEQLAAGAAAIPDAPTRPGVKLELTDGERSWPVAAFCSV